MNRLHPKDDKYLNYLYGAMIVNAKSNSSLKQMFLKYHPGLANNYRKMHHLPMYKHNKKYRRTYYNFWRRIQYNEELKYYENDVKVTKEILEYHIHSNMEELNNENINQKRI